MNGAPPANNYLAKKKGHTSVQPAICARDLFGISRPSPHDMPLIDFRLALFVLGSCIFA